MIIRNGIEKLALILFAVGILAALLRVGQYIEAKSPDSPLPTQIFVGSWVVTVVLAALVEIYDQGVRYGEKQEEKRRDKYKPSEVKNEDSER